MPYPQLALSLILLLAGMSVAAQPSPNAPPRGTFAEDRGAPDDAGEPPMTPAQEAARAAIAHYQRDLEQQLRASASPRDWALSVQVMHADDSEAPDPADAARGALLRRAAQAAPNDRLVQWTWAIAPAELSGCTAASPCRNRGSALARLEPDNGAAWVPAVIDAVRYNDQPGIDDALAHLGAATRYDEVFHDQMGAWLDAFGRFPMPQDTLRAPDGRIEDARSAAVTAAFSQISATTPAYDELIRACQRAPRAAAAPVRTANCAKAGRRMLESATTIIGRFVGGDLLRAAGPQDAADRDRIRALAWQAEQHMRLAPNSEGDQARVRTQLELLASSESEVAAMQEELRGANVPLAPPASWQPKRQGPPPRAPRPGQDADPNPVPDPDRSPR